MSYANSYSFEDTLAATSATLTFPVPVREIQITNDSPTDDLQFRLNPSEDYRTLHALETATLCHVRVPALYINSAASVAYRIWGLG